MSKQRVLIKIGGNALGRDDTTVADLVSLQNRGYRPVVVHGGGKTITEWLERMDVPTRFVEGLRVTDAGSIDVVVAVLAGLMNKRIVAEINAAYVNALEEGLYSPPQYLDGPGLRDPSMADALAMEIERLRDGEYFAVGLDCF